MFTGSYAINMDAKGRMAIPTRVREGLVAACDGRFVLTAHSQDRCLLIYPHPIWEEVLEKMSGLPNMNRATRIIQRRIIGNACPQEMDGNGRVLVPPTLRSYADLEKKLMLAGVGDKLELWSEERWFEQMDDLGDEELPEQLQSLVL